MRNPFKLPEDSERFITIPDHIEMNKRVNTFIDILTVSFLLSLTGVIIIGWMRYNDLQELDKWKGKHRQDSLQEIHMKQNEELLKDSV